MSAALKVRVLLIRSWIHTIEPVRVALRELGYELHVTRVDLEPALNAALSRHAFDLVLYDPAVAGISRAAVEAHLRERRLATPVVVLGELTTLADVVAIALAAGLN